MSEIDFSALVLGWIVAYGSPVVGGILLLSGLGLPIPATLIVIASGAFIRLELLNLAATSVWGFLGVILGDIALYGLGYFASGWIKRRFGQSNSWENARALIDRRGGLAIFLSRWILTATAMPTTLIAASGGYRFRKFLAFDMLGELIWILLYGSLGYAFGSQWELISDFVSNFSGFILGALALGVGLYLLVHFNKKSPRLDADGSEASILRDEE